MRRSYLVFRCKLLLQYPVKNMKTAPLKARSCKSGDDRQYMHSRKRKHCSEHGFWVGKGNVLVVVCVDSLFGLLIFVVFFLACVPETLKILNAASADPMSLRDQFTFCSLSQAVPGLALNSQQSSSYHSLLNTQVIGVYIQAQSTHF